MMSPLLILKNAIVLWMNKVVTMATATTRLTLPHVALAVSYVSGHRAVS